MPGTHFKKRGVLYANDGAVVAPAPSGAPGNAQAAIDAYFMGNSATAPQISYKEGAIAADQAARIEAAKNDRLAMDEALAMGLTNEQIMQYQDEWQGEPGREHWVGSHFSGPEHSKPIYGSFSDWWKDAKAGPGVNNNVYGGKAANVSAENNAKGLGKPMGIWSIIDGLRKKPEPAPVFNTPAPQYGGTGSSEASGGSGPGTPWSEIKTSAARHAVESDFEQDGTGRQGWNIGGSVMDDDVWGTDPLAAPAQAVDLGQGRSVGHAQVPAAQQGAMNALLSQAAGAAVNKGVGMGIDKLFLNAGGEAKQKMSAGQWVGKRCRYLVDGGMAQPEAEMQAYNEMQGLTGPNPVGASFEMPQEAPMPEQYSPKNNFGYVPSGGMTYKEQMEADKVEIQRAQAMDKEDRDNRAFEAAERRKDEAHAQAMANKQEGHQESMRQKRSGPLGGGSNE